MWYLAAAAHEGGGRHAGAGLMPEALIRWCLSEEWAHPLLTSVESLEGGWLSEVYLTREQLAERLSNLAAYCEQSIPVIKEWLQPIKRNKKKNSKLLILGGDHSGSVAVGASLTQVFGKVGVVWIDAHADLHTPATSPSGNPHGMPVGAMLDVKPPRKYVRNTLNKKEKQLWEKLTSLGGRKPMLSHEQFTYVGLRSCEPAEEYTIKALGIEVITSEEINGMGFISALDRIEKRLHYCDAVWISLDVDAIDGAIMRAVDAPVGGGLTPEGTVELICALVGRLPVVVWEIVELNVLRDSRSESLKLLSDIIRGVLERTS